MSVIRVPSRVSDEDYLTVDVPWVASDSEWRKWGKWFLIQKDANLSFVDHAWVALGRLVEDGTLVGLKVSTAAKLEKGSVVICYTRCGKQEAMRSAGAIRKLVDFPGFMYYKLNEQTDAGLAHRYGRYNFTVYAHTYCGGFYSRDSYGAWFLDRGDEQISIPDASPWRFQRFHGSSERPSKVNKLHLSKGSEEGPHWYLFCALQTSRDHQRLPEADRVWAVARRLHRENAASAISWRKGGNCAEIRFYVTKETDVRDWLQFCDRIFDEAATQRLLYYYPGDDEREAERNEPHALTGHKEPKYVWKYTYDRELYCQERFVMQNTKPHS